VKVIHSKEDVIKRDATRDTTLILIGPPRTGKTQFIEYTFDKSFSEGDKGTTICKKYTFTPLDSKPVFVYDDFIEIEITSTLTIIDTPGFGEDTHQKIQECLKEAVHKPSTVVVLLFWKFIESETKDIELSLNFVNNLHQILKCEVQKHVVLSFASLDKPSKLPLKWRQMHTKSSQEELCQIWKQEREKFFTDKGFSSVLCVEMGEDEDKQKVKDFFSKMNITPKSFRLLEYFKFQRQKALKSMYWSRFSGNYT